MTLYSIGTQTNARGKKENGPKRILDPEVEICARTKEETSWCGGLCAS